MMDAKKAFDELYEKQGGYHLSGDPMPKWEDLTSAEKQEWASNVRRWDKKLSEVGL